MRFTQDPPRCVALILCDAVSRNFGSERVSVLGLFDYVIATHYPMPVGASAVAIFSGVVESFECTFETVGYDVNPLGIRQEVGKATVNPVHVGTIATVFVTGTILFPVAGPSTADLRVYGNSILLGSRPVTIIAAPQPPGPPGAVTPPGTST